VRNSRDWRKQRKTALYNEVEQRYFIFCEGEKTEPNYFEAFKLLIEKNPIYKNTVQIKITGTGMNTLSILEFAQESIEATGIEKASIWCIYDKDNFAPRDFNAVEERIISLNRNSNSEDNKLVYNAGWSNQCIEYWFILHFDYYVTDNHRKYYIEYLNKKFKAFGLENYAKNSKDIFEILCKHGNPRFAICNAKKRISECRGKTPSASAPATKIYKLVEEIIKYLPKDVSHKFE
jgi:hypothetical protein